MDPVPEFFTRTIGRLPGPGPLLGACWSPSGKYLASYYSPNKIKIVSRETQRTKTLTERAGSISDVAWHPDDQTLISASSAAQVRIWNTDGQLVRSLGAEASVSALSVNQHNGLLAAGSEDMIVRIWDVHAHKLIQRLLGCRGAVTALSWSPNGQYLAVGDRRGLLIVYDTRGSTHQVVSLSHGITSVVWSPSGAFIAIGCRDCAIYILRLNEPPFVSLEGHTTEIASLSYNSDGRLLASCAADGSIRFWRTADWQAILTMDRVPASKRKPFVSMHSVSRKYLSFSTTGHEISILSSDENSIETFSIDVESFINKSLEQFTVQYTTAKIALVGDSGVGKTGLGWVLAHEEYKEHSSTHGQQFWVVDQLGMKRADGTDCEAVLWDLAGQPDYRLIHSLFLDDVNLALLLFDPSHRTDPLKSVEYWLKQLSHCQGESKRSILIGARIDRGTSTLTDLELKAYCDQKEINGGYILTSAKTGVGIRSLTERIKSTILWDKLPATITTTTFKRIKQYVLSMKQNPSKDLLLTFPQLQTELEKEDPSFKFDEMDLAAAVRHLANHGYVSVIHTFSGEQIVLLAPEILSNLASSFVLEARRNARGLGALEEELLLRDSTAFPELQRLNEHEREIMVDATITLFLKHNICFRSNLGKSSLLIFPGLINEKRPPAGSGIFVDDVSYTLSGAVDTIYASLVVLMGYTNVFSRTNQWQNQAQYEIDTGEVCGFRLTEEREGEIDIVLYYGEQAEISTPPHTKLLFEGLFERFLRTREVRITKYPPVKCSRCGYLQERSTVVSYARKGKTHVYCSDCGHKIPMPSIGDEQFLPQREREELSREQSVARRRTLFEAALVQIRANIRHRGLPSTPTCFICYAWGDHKSEKWTTLFVHDLRNAGVLVLFDRHDLQPGSSISTFTEQIMKSDFVLVVGTANLTAKYEKSATESSVVAAELRLISTRLRGTESARSSVIPILLEGKPADAFPPQLLDSAFVDFRLEHIYFEQLLDLLIRIHNLSIPPERREALRNSLNPDA